jgi:hypothetical protein
MITGVYLSISEVHLHRYLEEFDFRYFSRIKLGAAIWKGRNAR